MSLKSKKDDADLITFTFPKGRFLEHKTRCLPLNFEPLITNEEERKAFFINLYNIQMIHGLVAQKNLPETPTKVQVRDQKFFLFYNILHWNIFLIH